VINFNQTSPTVPDIVSASMLVRSPVSDANKSRCIEREEREAETLQQTNDQTTSEAALTRATTQQALCNVVSERSHASHNARKLFDTPPDALDHRVRDANGIPEENVMACDKTLNDRRYPYSACLDRLPVPGEWSGGRDGIAATQWHGSSNPPSTSAWYDYPVTHGTRDYTWIGVWGDRNVRMYVCTNGEDIALIAAGTAPPVHVELGRALYYQVLPPQLFFLICN
jgi:hypothetical protein